MDSTNSETGKKIFQDLLESGRCYDTELKPLPSETINRFKELIKQSKESARRGRFFKKNCTIQFGEQTKKED
ncbi:MAG: hypothetical protein US83_C0001G0052 [Candidatus Falkowbacteria bacterium GW2011_GWC2_38_22]|uniref:Uncharacterized protein n=1 Tax=Candidatus Falkowbacteria bacterium GW2011_GWE1_38_31 TaxID=1618638 RepID=A0A0G0JTY7_9BACT|nr:MAG: hypothetical protein US73_C0004G0076 [Candidatus Falkowbacteria bacterium GW2011_GWF2_38_1205]KKQ62118.1 MAG: hypothetical protein US83_C0001G0052 [Candidatus Falkowbacteria bacterium GW2011_GWC2_38_22]KKQ64268.1 MAG: hypothetical protein US84_C0001G0052 [Candidatus Falkowbacteria bacterium GW2011_GWF1_38_22]KKQ66245.1 MAG: hypothetical protein US87_C0002G0052 [Candidatus Falkowbacteria bacterium GW2011_GWE2_38_254]KKQ70973.1 MAG: hypothetical protein US91_C0002G0052 [Candidatus Falkowb